MAIVINAIEVSPLGDEALQVAVVEGIHLIGQQFRVLTDTPSSYGLAHSMVKMNSTGDGLDYTPAADGVVIDNASIRLDIDSLPSTPSITSSSIVAISTGGVHNSVNLEDAIQSYTNFLSLSDTPASFGSAQSLVKVNSTGDGLDYTPAAAGIAIDNDSIRMDIDSLPAASSLSGESLIASSFGGVHETIIVQDIIECSLTETEFFAAAEDRKRNNAGSGFLEWGKHSTTSPLSGVINEGLWAYSSSSNLIRMGRSGSDSSTIGSSRVDEPIALVNGTQHSITQYGDNILNGNFIVFPDAPDGTKTYDSATGVVIQHTDAATAFAAETVTNKVITTRKDLVFLETWHEAISEKDIVVPLGNVQYGESSYNGISLVDLDTIGVGQQYSAFGEWDSSTQGKGSRWSTLTDSEKSTYIADPENNIYFDSVVKSYIQVRYRIRVIEGNGNLWESVSQSTYVGDGYMCYKNGFSSNALVNPRGQLETISDIGTSAGGLYDSVHTASVHTQSPIITGGFASRDTATNLAHNNICHALPIALVQRLNQGAYHPVHNSEGCDTFGGSNQLWYEYTAVTSALQCFTDASGDGAIGELTGRDGNFEFYDAIYAGLVEDLRLNANKLDYDRLLNKIATNDSSGKTRGKGKLSRTVVYEEIQAASAIDTDRIQVVDENVYEIGQWVTIATALYETIRVKISSKQTGVIIWNSNIYGVLSKDVGLAHVFAETELTSEYDELPWVDVSGRPDRVLMTFPEGFIGRWIPAVSAAPLPLNYKCLDSTIDRVYSSDGGVTWIQDVIVIDTVANSTENQNTTTDIVSVWPYDCLSHFTEASVNMPIVGVVGKVLAGSFSDVDSGNRLQPSLITTPYTGANSHTIPKSHVLLNYTIDGRTGAIYSTDEEPPVHEILKLNSAAKIEGNVTFKSLYTLVEENGLLYAQYNGAELIHTAPSFIGAGMTSAANFPTGSNVHIASVDGSLNGFYVVLISIGGATFQTYYDQTTIYQGKDGDIILNDGRVAYKRLSSAGWGDDEKILIVDGETRKTDYNGNSVKVFCHKCMIPLGIASNN